MVRESQTERGSNRAWLCFSNSVGLMFLDLGSPADAWTESAYLDFSSCESPRWGVDLCVPMRFIVHPSHGVESHGERSCEATFFSAESKGLKRGNRQATSHLSTVVTHTTDS